MYRSYNAVGCPITQHNVDKLLSLYNQAEERVKILGPASGEQACGEWGEGRLLEPEEIFAALNFDTKQISQNLVGKTVLITAGPTREPIDPARCLTNYSSGKMGYALAEQARNRGARVVLVSGPTSLARPAAVDFYAVETAAEMDAQVQHLLTEADIFIGCAAVADYHVKTYSTQKIKKLDQEILNLSLVKNPDIISRVAVSPNRPACVVGFAAETDDFLTHAQEKLSRKGLDWIIVNPIYSPESNESVFANDHNEAQMLSADGRQFFLERSSKQLMAEKILDTLAANLAVPQSPCYDRCPQS